MKPQILIESSGSVVGVVCAMCDRAETGADLALDEGAIHGREQLRVRAQWIIHSTRGQRVTEAWRTATERRKSADRESEETGRERARVSEWYVTQTSH